MQIIKYKNTFAVVLLVVLACGGFTNPAFADVAVIINKGNDISSIKKSTIKKFFLRKKKAFSNGKATTPVEQVSGNIRDTFNDKVLRKTSSQLKAYWAKIIFSGKGSPPKSVADDAAVKAFVAKTDGAIGYIDSAKVDDSVKVIFTIK